MSLSVDNVSCVIRFRMKRPPPVKGKEEDYIYSSLISSFSNTKLFLIYYYLFFNPVYLSVPAHRSPRAIKTGENCDDDDDDGEIAVRRITITLNKWTHKSVESEFARAKSEWQRKPFRTTEKRWVLIPSQLICCGVLTQQLHDHPIYPW